MKDRVNCVQAICLGQNKNNNLLLNEEKQDLVYTRNGNLEHKRKFEN